MRSTCHLLPIVSFFWLIPSLVQGSYFISPADTTYDALGLMKRINVQSASALADAREVLASGSQCGNKNFDEENKENIDAENETGTGKPQNKIMVRSSHLLHSVPGIVELEFLRRPFSCFFPRYIAITNLMWENYGNLIPVVGQM